ncbi:MAG: hypothetical protein GTN70_02385 [Deltaproteobacteria bacterium]|nr:hypothetical protein [Deltaproteobacteria bacterium]NIS76490.1 hypothetical protein [Deltaproteobacteria bacterium]
MGRVAAIAALVAACLMLLSSCSQTRARYVAIQYGALGRQQKAEGTYARLTVNDFSDVREDRDGVGVDYTNAADIFPTEPVGTSVSQVIGSILQEKGFEVIRISRQDSPEGYSAEYEAEYHLTGAIEELTITVKGKGLLVHFDSRGVIQFSLFNGVGKMVWSGKMQAELSTSSPFVTEKAIEKSINECVMLLGEALAKDEKFLAVTATR